MVVWGVQTHLGHVGINEGYPSHGHLRISLLSPLMAAIWVLFGGMALSESSRGLVVVTGFCA